MARGRRPPDPCHCSPARVRTPSAAANLALALSAAALAWLLPWSAGLAGPLPVPEPAPPGAAPAAPQPRAPTPAGPEGLPGPAELEAPPALPQRAGSTAVSPPPRATLPPDPAGPPPTPEELDGLRQEIEALELLLAGKPPQGMSVASLFEVDLRDEQAVAASRQVLRGRLAKLRAWQAKLQQQRATPPAAAPVQAPAAPERGDADGGARPPTADAGVAAAAAEARDDGGLPAPASPAATAAPPLPPLAEAAPEELELRLTLADLRIRREELRLRYLELPLPQRVAVFVTEEQRRRLAVEQEAAQRAKAEAELAARLAEEARQAAMKQAREAETAAAKAIAGERARAEAARGKLARQRGELAAERERISREAEALLEARQGVAQQARAPELDPAAALRLYGEVIRLLVEHHGQMAEAMEALHAPSRAVPYRTQIEPPPKGAASPAPAELRALLAAAEEVEAQARLLAREEQENRWRRAEALARDVAELDRLRLELMTRLSPERQEALLGFTRDGLEQLGRELYQLGLFARWYPLQRLASLRELGGRLGDLVTLGVVGWTLLKLLVLLVVALYVRRGHEAWLRRSHALALKRLRNRSLQTVVDRWFSSIGAVAGPVGLLVFLYLFFRLLELDEVPEVELGRALLLGFAWYRVVVAVVHHALNQAAQTSRFEVSPELSERILRSVRLAGRYALTVVVLLLAFERVLGRGFLYHLVVQFFWVGSVPVALVLIQRWRRDIARAYLDFFPGGRFARAVERSRERPVGFLVAMLAFGAVAARGVALYLRHNLLNIQQTRRALAFLFRRRLEKQAESMGHGTTDVSLLPRRLQEAFADRPVGPGCIVLDHWPHLEEVQRQVRRWRAGERGAAIALVGERGIGKSSWLQELARRQQQEGGEGAEEIRLLTLPHRLASADELIRWLTGALELDASRVDPSAPAAEALIRALRSGPRRLVLIDGCQDLMLRAVGGLAPVDLLGELAARTSAENFWVCAFSRYAWEHIASLHPGRNLFQQVLALPPWTEEQIGLLIRQRMKSTGLRASYEDLVVDRLEGSEIQTEVIRTGERYLRLLWDYSGGNPRVALHFWLRSLLPDGDEQVRVRLFAAPSADELEGLDEQSRFLLAAVVVHEALSTAEATRSLRYPQSVCEALLERLCAQGILQADSGGRYRVITHYNRAVLRYLRRKHLIFT